MGLWKRFWSRERRFTSLHDAAEQGALKAVAKYLRAGMDPNAVDARGATALHIAAARGHLEIVRLLADRGATVHFRIPNGGTPLMSAASCLRDEVVELLLVLGAPPNQAGEGGRFPLLCTLQPDVAAVAEQINCIRLLVAHGAHVNQRADGGETALMRAAWFGNEEAIEELLRLEANSTLVNDRGKTAAMLAFEREHDDLAILLRRHAGIDKKALRGADYVAAKKDFIDGLRSLHGFMQKAGIQCSVNPKVEALLAMATDEFLNDPEAHFLEEDLGYYGHTITADRALSHWESQHFVPAGTEVQANKEYSLLLRHRIRYEYPEKREEHIGIGLEHVSPV